MKDVSLCIIYKKIRRLNVLCFENNINTFINSLLSKKILIIKKNMHFIIIDSNFKLLSLDSKVPDQLFIIMIDLKEFYNQEKKHISTNNIKLIEKYIFTFETFIKENIKKKEIKTKKVIPKKKIKINKKVFKELIEPVIILEKKEIINTIINSEEVKKNKVIKKNAIKDNKKNKLKIGITKKPVKKIKTKKEKDIIKEEKVIIKKEDIKNVPVIKTKLIIKKDKTIKSEKPILIKEPKEKKIKTENIHIVVSIKNDNKPILAIVQKNNKEEKKVETIKNTEINKEEESKEKDINPVLENPKIIKKKELKNDQNIIDNVVVIDKKGNFFKSSNQEIKKKKEVIENKHEPLDILKKEKEEKNEEKNQEEIIEEQKITYTVLSPDEEVLYHKEISIKTPITIEQLLLHTGLMINNKEGFIESINGIKNEGMSGWVFEVNNVPVMVSAAEYIVNPNEQITWKYVDFSKMMEEENSIKEENIPKKDKPQKKLVKNRKENNNKK